MKKTALFLLFALIMATVGLFVFGCDSTEPDPDPEPQPEEVPYNSDVDNGFIATVTSANEVVVSSMVTDSGQVFTDGDTVNRRVVTISGTVPDYLGTRSTTAEPERVFISAHGGSCMSPGPWNAADTITTGFQQTIHISYSHEGVMCTGDWGYTITVTNIATGAIGWQRQVLQGIGADVDQTTGSLDLPAGTYEVHVSTVTGTTTRATVTYTPGGGGVVSSNIVVYHNGNLYPVSEASPGATYSHVVDLANGNNVIRVLVIGNFDAAAQIDLANILAVSDPLNVFCITEDMAIRVVLSWQIDNSDVDLHLIAPGGKVWSTEDCYFGNETPNWGDPATTLDDPSLDHDNTSGYGPETIVLPIPANGLYTVLVHYWGDHGGGDAPSRVVVTLNESSQRSFGPRTLVEGQYWAVTGIRVTNGTASFAAAPDSSSLFTPVRMKPAKK